MPILRGSRPIIAAQLLLTYKLLEKYLFSMKHSTFTGKLEFVNFIEIFDILATDITDMTAREHIHKALRYVYNVQDKSDLRPNSPDIAYTLKQLGVDSQTLIATLLSDPRLRDSFDQIQIEEEFNESIANLVFHVHWLNTFKECNDEIDYVPEEAEALRRLLLASVDDVRAVLIKLAFRVQRLRTLSLEPPEVHRCIAKETLDIFTPLANRLGIGELKWEMEDLAFRYLDPQRYKAIANSMAEKRALRESYISDYVDTLLRILKNKGIEAKAYGRPKHLYSIWKKMKRKRLECHELADLLAVRIVVNDISQCYLVLGIVHSLWKHIPTEFDDYIANPKENGYQSIHTAIIGPDQQIVEVQIRTQDMHEFAEHGVAAHWRYKEGSSQDHAMENTIAALRRILENREDDDSLLEEFKTELFSDRVLVLTPKAEVIDLPQHATALDFAYFIHTEVGHRCIGAIVNDHRVPLSYPLKSGECVEILTDDDSEPNLNWLNHSKDYVTTSKAIARIRAWFKTKYKNSDNNLLISSENLPGIGNHKVEIASCCHPQIGDHILGQLMPDLTIKLHRHTCPNLQSEECEHCLIELEWGQHTDKERVTIHIEAFDRQGLLQDITTLLNESQINVLKANTETDIIDQSVTMDLTIELVSMKNLTQLFKRIEFIPNVFRAYKSEDNSVNSDNETNAKSEQN